MSTVLSIGYRPPGPCNSQHCKRSGEDLPGPVKLNGALGSFGAVPCSMWLWLAGWLEATRVCPFLRFLESFCPQVALSPSSPGPVILFPWAAWKLAPSLRLSLFLRHSGEEAHQRQEDELGQGEGGEAGSFALLAPVARPGPKCNWTNGQNWLTLQLDASKATYVPSLFHFLSPPVACLKPVQPLWKYWTSCLGRDPPTASTGSWSCC